ncbi:MAG: hypothetical protein EAZ85_03315 [Bacteroidetes bacterium]|nr:MAG: hypothetical protein EAZ85_03315 [Bacteroidota bacterium]TAG85648.1 MAG: hypothetical protein EAZ20_14555 [Bacteroidota bacterium]
MKIPDNLEELKLFIYELLTAQVFVYDVEMNIRYLEGIEKVEKNTKNFLYLLLFYTNKNFQ